MSDFKLGDYVQVDQRIVEFREKYPEGSLQPVDLANPYRIETAGELTFIVYGAAAYRTPDDVRPGIGYAWEPFPGKTPYTKNSELMNAETSAWGRAIVATLAADAKRGIASAEEVRNRAAERDEPAQMIEMASQNTLKKLRGLRRTLNVSDNTYAEQLEKFGVSKDTDLTAEQADKLLAAYQSRITPQEAPNDDQG